MNDPQPPGDETPARNNSEEARVRGLAGQKGFRLVCEREGAYTLIDHTDARLYHFQGVSLEEVATFLASERSK